MRETRAVFLLAGLFRSIAVWMFVTRAPIFLQHAEEPYPLREMRLLLFRQHVCRSPAAVVREDASKNPGNVCIL